MSVEEVNLPEGAVPVTEEEKEMIQQIGDFWAKQGRGFILMVGPSELVEGSRSFSVKSVSNQNAARILLDQAKVYIMEKDDEV